jgi:hypothetical protein
MIRGIYQFVNEKFQGNQKQQPDVSINERRRWSKDRLASVARPENFAN